MSNNNTETPHPPIVIFDVDGPLIPSVGPRLLVLKYMHNPWFEWEEVVKRHYTSFDIIRMMESADTESNREYFNRIRRKFKPLIPKWVKRWSFFIVIGLKLRQYEYRYADFIDGAVDTIKQLDDLGIILGICSSSEKKRILKWLERKNITRFFPKFTSRDHKPKYGLKPDPRPVLGSLLMLKQHHQLGKIDKDSVVFVGDNVTDIISARAGGVKSIAVLSGHGLMRELKRVKPDFIVNNVTEIPAILPELFPKHF